MIYPHSQIWTPDVMDDIHSKAQGTYQLSGFRPLKEVPTFDELTFLASGLTRFPLEGYKEKCKTETVLGGRFASRPLAIETPIYVSSSPDLERDVRVGLARGSSLAHTAFSSQGAISAEERKSCQRLIHEVPADRSALKAVSAIKSEAIQVNLHSQTPFGLLAELVKKIRSEQESKVPVFVGLSAGRVEDGVKAAVKAEADGILIEGLNTVTITRPSGLMNYCRLPIIAAVPRARNALRDNKVLGEVSMMVGTGIRNGADAAKALALGADAVRIDDSALVAIGYYDRAAKKPASSGASSAGMVPARAARSDGGERVAKFINSITMEVALLARSLGKGDVHSLEYEDLSALTIEASLMSGVRLSGE
jgi:methylamine---glutamate N-methyltransferase subunit C